MNEQVPSTARNAIVSGDASGNSGLEKRRAALSIRSALIITVALSLTPALAIIIWTGKEHGAHLAESAKMETIRQAESFASIQIRITESARQMLSTIAYLPEAREGDFAHLTEVLKAIHTQNPEYLNFSATDTHGIVQASSRLSIGTDLHDRLHIKAALEQKRFSAGEYIVGLVGSEPAFSFAHPIFNVEGELIGVVGAMFKLSSYFSIFERLELPSDSFLGLVDRNGTRTFFYPAKASNPIGKPIVASVWDGIRGDEQSGIFTGKGSDGIGRYFGYRKLWLENSGDPYMYVVYAIPISASYALSQSILLRNILLMTLVAVFSMVSASLISKRLFGARLARIIATTSLLRHGDLRARVGFDDDHSDLGQIATALDQMAGTIEHRDADMAHDARILEASLAEKEILLQEVHHRVKNNLQLILSLFSLQENESVSPAEFKEAMENRIKAMSMVHEMLYESDNFGSIDLGSYARRLVELGSLTANNTVEVSVDAAEAPCSLDTAVPFGLMLNELVTNAYKHAFGSKGGGSLWVTLRIDDGVATLEVLDDGPGLPVGFSISEGSSLGLRLAQGLAEQLRGSLSWDEGPGARFIVKFRIDASRET